MRPPTAPPRSVARLGLARLGVAALATVGLATACAPAGPRPALRTATVLESIERVAAPPRPGAPALRLAVAPFDVTNVRATPLLGVADAISDLLAERLAAVSALEVLPPAPTARAVTRLVAEAGADSANAPRLAARLLTPRLVLGTISELPAGAGVRIVVRLADLDRGVLGEPVTADTRHDAIAQVVPGLARELVASLGLVPDSLERAALVQPLRPTLPALEAYAAGVRAEQRDDAWGARRHYRDAIRLDPSFVVAAQRAERLRRHVEGGSDAPQLLPGLRPRDAASALALDHVNRPLVPWSALARTASGAGDPAFPGTVIGLEIIVTRP
jgi:hypothetical protein